MKRIVVAIAVASAVGLCAMADAGKIMLRISSVETVDTRTQKSFEVIPIPAELKNSVPPHTDAEISKATPERAAEMERENAAWKRAYHAAIQNVQWQNWRKADEYMQGVKAKLLGTVFGRQVNLALDKFTGHASQCFNPNCIEFFHRVDAMEGVREGKFAGEETAPLSSAYFIKIVFDDPFEKKVETSVGGGVMSRSFFTQKGTFEVLENGGKVVCAANVEAKKAVTSASQDERQEVMAELLDECLSLIAKKINDHFVATVTFKALSVLKNDEEFNEDACSIEVDGVGCALGNEMALLKGEHMVKVELDGYKQKSASKMRITGSGTIKILMVSAKCKLTVTVKGIEDASTATIELVDAENNAESLTSGEVFELSHGKYVLTVSAEGCETKKQTLNLSKPVQNVVITLKKGGSK